MSLLIKNGRVINPATQLDSIKDILIEEGIVKQIDDKINVANLTNVASVIDATNLWVVPGLIDVHVHLREPGFEYKETIETGSLSAARGGFTSICPMPNTKPVVDCDTVVDYIKMKAEMDAHVHVLPVGAITKGQKGEELADLEKMKNAGICAISEDGRSVLNAGLLKKAMIIARDLDLPVLSHCEDESLVEGGCMNAGEVANKLGLKGISADSEEVIVARDILLANATGVKLHICHVSTQGSVDIIKHAKLQGQMVTAEVTPHHFTLSDEAVLGNNANTKMNPPLRTKNDVLAMKNALKNGTIEIIATDHAPHHFDEKACDYDKAANGIVGLETAVPLTITELVNEGYLTPMQMIEKMSYNPAKLLGIDKGNIDIGHVADITIINPTESFSIDAKEFASKSKNTPFDGRTVMGKVKYTIVSGVVKFGL